MKKYIFLILIIFISSLATLLNFKESYSYMDCSNTNFNPSGLTTNNFEDYLDNNNISDINYVCSYDICYHLTSSNLLKEKRNITSYLSKKSSEEQRKIAYAKGYTITKINYNNCNK